MALKVDYELRMEEPNKHYFQVKMKVSGFSGNQCLVKMPVWTPGSYKIREYGRYVEDVSSTSKSGETLLVTKVNKNSWAISNLRNSDFVVEYRVYAFQENIRMSFLDDSHAFITGTTVFMYVNNEKDNPGNLEIFPWKGFSKISTALPRGKDNSFNYSNYDHLVDCPIEIGNQEIIEFKDHGVNYSIAIYGEGNYKSNKLKKDVKKITAEATEVFGENPNKDYLFIIHNSNSRGGGLEHTNSTVLQLDRDSYKPEGQYERFLGLVAHEYFHVWNVKRIRAEVMGPFNYDSEIYTDLLWLFEGFTSYYDKLLLYRAGYKMKEEFLNAILGTIRSVESQPGNQFQSLRESSLDTWVKTYIRDENSVNTTISYYSKGSLVALLLDLKISAETNGKKNLDDFMQALYKKSEEGKQPINYDIVKEIASDVCGTDLSEFFRTAVEEPGSLDYAPFLKSNGVELSVEKKQELSLGLGLSNGFVRYVLRDSPAEKAGIYAGDLIISINGKKLKGEKIDEIMKDLEEDSSWKIVIMRKGLKKEIEMDVPYMEKPFYDISVSDETALERWLN